MAHLLWLAWEVLSALVLIRCVLSWTGGDQCDRGFVGFVYRVTEPLLAPIRRWLPPEKTGNLDFSPVVLLVAGGVLLRLVLRLF